MRILVTFSLLVMFTCSQSHSATIKASSTTAIPTAAIHPSPAKTSRGRVGKDIKPLPLPTKLPSVVKKRIDPNLRQFCVQINKYNSLRAKSEHLESWVYSYGFEPLIADYEDALDALDLCDDCLDEALFRLITAEYGNLQADPAIELVKSELEEVDTILDFIIEMAKLEL